ncbi:chemotaxis protein CheA [Photobacterium phosphoreum]|uniref:Chemotaxis protein CheA n=1 Tax=Photobacterium phosphoreum TaxID=659 RepID=A0A2T3JXJ7_PHOPO|nr:chemotaxis protein CheA [Photobacterium phosphoreum]PSU27617.1 chemotaxis protein CheA [Photobacterium phosphoreum]PSU41619.1 chemotaxis protein CheA [Photobacterium phosphoreum]PSU54108.1 chemotaxis protein CheA [Photobacterium phosphoreum]
MSFDLDEDILQDFLIEAGEILELLSEQLVELERRPDDGELLNAIFRGFHTVKGGAGFLSLGELVDACHGAENVFDLLRTGKRKVTSELMDVILEALDCINVMFAQVQAHQPLKRAEQTLLDQLHHYSLPPSAVEATVNITAETPMVAAEPSSVSSSSAIAADSINDITQDEFERLLDELHGIGNSPSSLSIPPSSVIVNSNSNSNSNSSTSGSMSVESNDITDDEFERLLDELHGSGNAPGAVDSSITTSATDSTPTSTATAMTPVTNKENLAVVNDDLMTDDEFENLLDELHGLGRAPQVNITPAVETPLSSPSNDPFAAINPHVPTHVAVSKVAVEPVNKPLLLAEKEKPKPKPQAETTVRVDTSTLDIIMNMVGELVLVRNRLVSLGLNTTDEEMSKAVSTLDVVTADLQGAVMKTRMQPIKKVFGRFPRVVRDLARSLNKEIVLEMEGEDTDLDKNLVEALADPLVHLVRNSVDHGIEMPAVREQAGKSPIGKVLLSASQEGDHIRLTIADDGSGMDANKLRQIAIDRGMMDSDAASRLSDNDAYNLIFAPGFSTKKEISDISGRGVGMDVVKTSINQLNGSIIIDSTLGKGTRIDIKVPLTLAILPTLMVGVAHQPFALPLASVNEIFHLDLTKTHTVDGQLTIIVREKAIPLFYLQDWLSKKVPVNKPHSSYGHVVIVQTGHQRVGFVVDSLIGQEEVVIKPLDKLLKGTPGMAGATITSDGHIALILDVPNLLNHYVRR